MVAGAPEPTAPAPDAPPGTTYEDVEASFTYIGRPPTRAAVHLVRRDRSRRIVRAVQSWGACWGLMVVAVFVPVLHFVLVPSLFLIGPLLGLQRLGERASVREASGACPGCGAPCRFTPKQGAKPRMPLRCEACGRAIALEIPPELLQG